VGFYPIYMQDYGVTDKEYSIYDEMLYWHVTHLFWFYTLWGAFSILKTILKNYIQNYTQNKKPLKKKKSWVSDDEIEIHIKLFYISILQIDLT